MIRAESIGPYASYNFTDALDRPYIPRDGLYPFAKYQLSVAPHPRLFIPQLEQLPFDEGIKDLYKSWQSILDSRANNKFLSFEFSDLLAYPRPSSYRALDPVAFGPTTEQLFGKFIVPSIKNYCETTHKTQVVMDNVSYLLPLWNRDKLEPLHLVEGELAKLIKEGGKLPDSIGAVFVDFPPNQQKREYQYNIYELLEFIHNHPDVLVIVDQANLWFSAQAVNLTNDLMFSELDWDDGDIKEKRLFGNDLVLVTNTSTKALGLSGCAVAAGTDRTKTSLGQKTEPYSASIFFENERELNQARASLALESFENATFLRYDNYDAQSAPDFRYITDQNKEKLETHLKRLFGYTSICPEHVGGARILIDANELGFKDAQSLCDTLAIYFSIATKPATVYVSPKKQGEWDKYVQMTIPWNDEIMQAVLNAFNKLHQMNKNRLRILKNINKAKKNLHG